MNAKSSKDPYPTPEAVEILRRACAKSKTRTKALADPRGLLASHGIELPADQELRLYERSDLPGKAGNDADPVPVLEIDRPRELAHVTPAMAAAWAARHRGCPFGTVPYKTTRKETVCDIWGVWSGPKEWVQDIPGTAWGHWEYPQARQVCVLSHTVDVEVTECLPYFHGLTTA